MISFQMFVPLNVYTEVLTCAWQVKLWMQLLRRRLAYRQVLMVEERGY